MVSVSIGMVVGALVSLGIVVWLGTNASEETDMNGVRATRKLAVGEVTEKSVWFEVCDSDAEDFQFQYGVPKRHRKYSSDELELVQSIEEGDRGVYEVTLRCENERGTLWLLEGLEQTGELPEGYRKNRLTL